MSGKRGRPPKTEQVNIQYDESQEVSIQLKNQIEEIEKKHSCRVLIYEALLTVTSNNLLLEEIPCMLLIPNSPQPSFCFNYQIESNPNLWEPFMYYRLSGKLFSTLSFGIILEKKNEFNIKKTYAVFLKLLYLIPYLK